MTSGKGFRMRWEDVTRPYPTLPCRKMQFYLETFFRILQVSARKQTVWLIKFSLFKILSEFSQFRHQAIRTFSPRYITTSPNCTATIFLVNKLLSWDDYRRTAFFCTLRVFWEIHSLIQPERGNIFLNNYSIYVSYYSRGLILNGWIRKENMQLKVLILAFYRNVVRQIWFFI